MQMVFFFFNSMFSLCDVRFGARSFYNCIEGSVIYKKKFDSEILKLVTCSGCDNVILKYWDFGRTNPEMSKLNIGKEFVYKNHTLILK